MKKSYKSLRKNIPNKLKVRGRTHYEVLWSENFAFEKDGNKVYGITRFEPKQIVISTTQGDREAVHTLYHEFIHALSEEYDIKLSEPQVVALEKSFGPMAEFFEVLEGKKK